MKKIRFMFLFLLMAFTFVLVSCEAGSSPYSVLSIEMIGQNEEGYIYEILFVDNNKYQFVIPFGIDGKDGNNGETPYIGNNNNWWIGNQDLGIKAEGTQGIAGNDGITPEIGHNGNWWIGNQDTGVKAISNDGKDGIDGQDGKDGTNGTNGLTPYIGENGNWWLDGLDLEIRAEGTDGQDGKDGSNGQDGTNGLTPYIGENGNWWLDGIDLEIRAEGIDGNDGADGKDGTDGQDGKDGINGQDGKDGITPFIGYNGNWWLGDLDTGVYAGYKQDPLNNMSKFDFALNRDNESYYLAVYNGKDRVVAIPNMINGLPVSGVGLKAFKDNEYLEKIIIPNTVTEIEYEAFYGALNLHEVVFQEGTLITKIGDHAFHNTNLTDFEFHEGLTYIGNYAFANNSFTEIIVPNTVEFLGRYSFHGNNELESISIPFVGTSLNPDYRSDIYNDEAGEAYFGIIFGYSVFSNTTNSNWDASKNNHVHQGQTGARSGGGTTWYFINYYIPDTLTTINITYGKTSMYNNYLSGLTNRNITIENLDD